MTKSSAPKAPASQLAAMSGVVAATKSAPVSQLAMFVHGDVKGGEAAHNFRMQTVAASIREALKGNSRALIEARTFAEGKAKKARAYAAGFDAVGVPARVQYVGKLDAPENEAARRTIMEQSASLEFAFESAFLTVFSAKAEPKASAPKLTAEDHALAAEAYAALEEENNALKAQIAAPALDAEVADVVGAAVRAIAAGLATTEEVESLRAALAQHDAARATLAALEQMASEPATA